MMQVADKQLGGAASRLPFVYVSQAEAETVLIMRFNERTISPLGVSSNRSRLNKGCWTRQVGEFKTKALPKGQFCW
jgi:hypothetical protein